jgi:acetyl esterase/lipase
MKVFYRWLSLSLSGLGIALSSWIIIPAPTLLLLPLSVGAPEVSSWLFGLNALGLLLGALLAIQSTPKRWGRIAVGLSLVGIILCFLPLSQLSVVNQRAIAAMSKGLGSDYLAKVSQAVKAQMRPQPFGLADSLRGIPAQTIRYTPNIPFSVTDGVPLSLDIYQPPQVGQYPAIVVIYGGAWQAGSPTSNEAFSRYMAARGYVVWAIAYRHAPQYQFPAQLEDVEAALHFLKTHAVQYETDSNRIAVLGRSAGAQLAMLAAYRPSTTPVQAVVDYYGPVDLAEGYYNLPNPSPIDIRLVLNLLLGGSPSDFPKEYKFASPIYAVTPSAPPSLLIYGGRDNVVQAKYGRQMYKRLQAVGGKAVYLEIPWADHAFDSVFNGISNQLALYYTERFLAWALLST